MPREAAPIGVTARALAVLAAFDEEHRSLRMVDIARRAGLPTSTAHRLLRELVAWGALVRGADGEYRVGARLWRLGMLAESPGTLREAAAPFLQDVYAATLATVHLAVREGTDAVFVARLAGNRSVPILTSEGDRAPLHATAVGKVLLAYAPAEVQAAVVAGIGPGSRRTARTLAAPALLARQLERVLSDGFAVSTEEMSVGASAIAVPVTAAAAASAAASSRAPAPPTRVPAPPVGPAVAATDARHEAAAAIGARHEVVAAIGAATTSLQRDRERLLAALRTAARGIGRAVGPHR